MKIMPIVFGIDCAGMAFILVLVAWSWLNKRKGTK